MHSIKHLNLHNRLIGSFPTYASSRPNSRNSRFCPPIQLASHLQPALPVSVGPNARNIMSGRRVTKSAIDWAAFAARVPEDQQISLKAFKTRHDAYLSKAMSYPDTPPKIDWETYKKKIPVPGLVDQFQKQMASVKVSYPKDTLTSQIDQQEQEALASTKRFVQESNRRIEKLRTEAKQWEDMLPIHKMTMEEFILEFPENAHGFDQKRYQTLYPHNYDPKAGLIPGEKGSGAWNIGGPDRHLEDKDAH